jgi:hypothetical protein
MFQINVIIVIIKKMLIETAKSHNELCMNF